MIASSVIMIRPTAFGFNTETAPSNAFQHSANYPSSQVQLAALKEFEALYAALTEKGIEVIPFNDTVVPTKPDAIFPNNWFSTHADGTIFLYPMLSPVRRKERREDILERLKEISVVKELIDLSPFEDKGKFLEGTGSLVFDHSNKIIYAALSPRTDAPLAQVVADELKHELVTFKTADKKGEAIYHTNVVMNVSDSLAVVCFDCITENKAAVKQTLQTSGKEIIEISVEQMENFCGNMLLLQNKQPQKFMVMSERAFKSLDAAQMKTIEKHAEIIYSSLSTIEEVGGGSARCMLAEVYC